MSKKEIVWRYILCSALKKILIFRQKEIAANLKISVSTVFNALKIPRKSGAVEISGRFFRVTDFEKLLLIWATARDLASDVIYETHTDMPARAIEGIMPPGLIFGAFSAYRFSYNEAPADYDRVYVYADNLIEIKKRFPKNTGRINFFVLKSDPLLSSYGQVTPDPQTFVDLWNIPVWYAKDYLTALKEKMNI